MANGIAGLFVGSLGLIIVFGYAWMVFMGVFVPIWMFVSMSRLGSIAKELRRMNGMPVPDGGGLFPNATVRAPERGAQSLTHQLTR